MPGKLERIYFIGIGGIGMSALARHFYQHGAVVNGYDRTETGLTIKLREEGIGVVYEDDPDLLDKDASLVVYTPAVSSTHRQLSWYRENGYQVRKRSEVLQMITESLYSLTVAGTHGKTTISTMIAYLLRESGYGCNAFLGGISGNYGVNYWSSENKVAVIEADEFDRSFLKLSPDVALLTSMDPDHLDIYGSAAEMEEAFIGYTRNIKPEGTLIARHGLARLSELKAPNTLTYSLQNDAADVYATNIVQKDGGYHFDVVGRAGIIQDLHLPMGGMHNVENAVAAITAVRLLDVSADAVRNALGGFKGVKRRFEYVVRNEQVVYIDDYAHHPEELRAVISSARQLFRNRRCVVVFQPHLYSRTRDLSADFARSLDLADEVILMDIYPAREAPVAGVTSAIITEKMVNPAHTILSREGVLEYVKQAPLDLLITAGAGDIDRLVPEIKEILMTK